MLTMPTGHSPKPFSQILEASTLDALAKQSGLVQRVTRKFSPSGFLCSLLKSVVAGTGSLSRLADKLGEMEQAPMSRQGMCKRFSEASTRFLSAVLTRMMSGLELLPSRRDCAGGIARILVQDSTVFAMHPGNAAYFKGTGGRGSPGAAAKTDLVYDLLSGRPLAVVARNGSDPDQGYARTLLESVGPGDLVLRDRGYFSLEALEEIGARNALWVSRLPASVTVLPTGAATLEEVLAQAEGDELELEVLLGASHRIRCRLVARRLDEASAARARNAKKKTARDHGKTASQASLIQAGWQILLTNVEAGEMDTRQLFALYAWRWQIEIQFRAIKQSSDHAGLFAVKRGRHQLEALVQAILIYALHCLELNRTLATHWRRGANPAEVSVEKAAQWLAERIRRLTEKQSLTELLNIAQCDKRIFFQEKRKKRKSMARRVHETLGYNPLSH